MALLTDDDIDMYRSIHFSADDKTAQEALYYLANNNPSECDIWIELLKYRPTADVFENVISSWKTRGNLQRFIPNGKICRNPHDLPIYRTAFFGHITIGTKDQARLAYAHYLIDIGKFSHAHDLLQDIKKEQLYSHDIALTEITLFFATRRWNDIIACKETITINPESSFSWEIIRSLAYAHLGKTANITEDSISYEPDNDDHIGDMKHLCHCLTLLITAARDEKLIDYANLPDDFSHITTSLIAKYCTWFWHTLADEGLSAIITSEQRIAGRDTLWDANSEPKINPHILEDDTDKRTESLQNAEKELASFYGLTMVKDQITKLKNIIKVDHLRKQRELPVETKTQHLIFEGPPGVGKTTIARVIAKLYYGLSITDKETVIEVGRSDIVGQHIGETEVKVNTLIDHALGGVLFIDEAYSLVSTGSKNDFGLVAVNTLLARMENERAKFIVIIAGYANDLVALLEANEGLRSRFKDKISFTSYSPDELVEMAEMMVVNRGTILSPESKKLLEKACIFLSNQTMTDEKKVERRALDVAGNARFVRNILDHAEDARDHRIGGQIDTKEFTNTDLQTVSYEDMREATEAVINILGLPDDFLTEKDEKNP